ncbi:MAG: dockerin type I repeat-containing protein [Clostridia bacterium]|nr:dockerin type I repeat-containing protein [Clostridia bacterium]
MCVLRAPRENIYFENCYFYNGSTCGFYGGIADAVYDSCTFERVGRLYQWAFAGDVNWYISYNDNEVIYDPYFSHDDGGLYSNEFSELAILAAGSLRYSRCFTIRGFNFNGMRLGIETSATKDALSDLIVDNNTFHNSEYGIYWNNTKGSMSIEGALLYRNVFDDVDIPYSDSILSISGVKNKYFSEKMIIYGDKNYEQKLLLGDVNGDGVISLKDCTCIRYYCINRIAFDENQKNRADVNEDGVIDLKDATMIRYFIVGKIDEF